MITDEEWMQQALQLAKKSEGRGEVPVGAIIVYQNEIIGKGWNQPILLHDPTAHAEMIAITQAAEALGDWRLADCTRYVTLEPCPMCAGAIVQARLPTVIFGAADPKAGGCQSLYAITNDERLNHRSIVIGGVLEHECGTILSEFFQMQRDLGKK